MVNTRSVVASTGVHSSSFKWRRVTISSGMLLTMLPLLVSSTTFSSPPHHLSPTVVTTSTLHFYQQQPHYYENNNIINNNNTSSTMNFYSILRSNAALEQNSLQKKKCTNSNDCSVYLHAVCISGWCKCAMGYYMNGSSCLTKFCHDSVNCIVWSNSRCGSNHQCVCEDDFEVDQATQTCRYHFMATMSEPYFYGPFVSFVAVVILFLAIWYFCCRRRRRAKYRGNGTTIIFHKGDFPLFRVSNTVATDHIPTISQSVVNSGGGGNGDGNVRSVASYTPFDGGDAIIIDNAVYRRTHSTAHLSSAGAIVCAHCALRHQEDHRCLMEQYSTVNGVGGPSVYHSNHANSGGVNGGVRLVHGEHSYPVMSRDLSYHSSPPPPPPPPPPYTPLSDKVPVIY